jgi:hypothetical protein
MIPTAADEYVRPMLLDEAKRSERRASVVLEVRGCETDVALSYVPGPARIGLVDEGNSQVDIRSSRQLVEGLEAIRSRNPREEQHPGGYAALEVSRM